ncbi:hypothetical protein ACXYTP_19485 [Tsukamurella ocularis]|uniref:hypothetical protein n=1 Tax=Tsukamurella ocularis TaxID=1970234 RepID=UPI0039F0BA63
MEAKSFAERDKQWGAHYLLVLAGQDGINREILVRRQNELVDSVAAAGVPAAELFGDPGALARADAAELGSADVAAAAAESFGMHDILTVAGWLLLLQGLIAGIVVLVGGDGPVDVTVGPVILFAAIATTMLGGLVAVGEFSAGRVRRAAIVAVATVVALAGGVVLAGWAGDWTVLIADAPIWGIALACLLPGVLVIGASRFVPERQPHIGWTDEEWFAQLRDGLLAMGVSGETAREHERALRAGVTATAVDDYGQPGAMARRLAADDPAAPRRRWRLKVAVTAVFVVGIALGAAASLVDEGLSWGSVSFLVVFVLLAPAAVRVWRSGPAEER